MQTFVLRALGALLAFAFAVPDAHAVQERTGRTPGGAAFKIRAPDGWKAGDGLVLYQHGFNFDVEDSPGLGPLEPLLLQQGYAVAASGYRQRGWALFTALDDNAELVERFTTEFGAPGSLYTFGGSMGGLISLKLAEDPRFVDRMKGVYAVCAPAAGARTWDAAFDLKVAYDAICASTGALPRGSAPHTWALDLDDVPDDLDDPLRDSDLLDALVPVSLCTGLNFPDSLETERMRERRDRLMDLAGTRDEDTLTTLLAYAIFGTADLLRAPDKLAGRNPWQNSRQSVVYEDAYWNEVIAPVWRADPFAPLDFRRVSSLYGNGKAKIVALHTSGDEIVVPGHLGVLAEIYGPTQATRAVATESEPSHCGFEAPELAAGWEALRRWTNGTAQPTVSDLQAGCELARNAGVTGQCRLGPPTVASIDETITPRRFRPTRPVSGSWYDPARPGEGFTLEIDPAEGCVEGSPLCEAAVSWYTYPAANESGPQRWIVGAARAEGEQWLVVDDARIGVTGAFAGSGVTAPWGNVELEIADDGRGYFRYAGAPAYGTGLRPISQLTYLGSPCTSDCSPDVALDPARARRAGTYYDAARPGSGLVLQLQLDPNAPQSLRAFVTWYTYDALGQPLWLVGEGRYLGDARTLSFDVFSTTGPRFGPQPITDTATVPWGELLVRFPTETACDATALEWRPRSGTGGTHALTRLTAPFPDAGTACRP